MSNALYMFGVEVGSIPHGLGASTNAQGLHIPPSSDPGFQPTSQIWTEKSGGNGLRMDPYPHPLHMKVVVLPLICLVWMWEAFHVGLEPQPLHKGHHLAPSSVIGF